MSLNGTSTLINGKIAQSKVRGRALVKALGSAYDQEESGAAASERTKKIKSHGKK